MLSYYGPFQKKNLNRFLFPWFIWLVRLHTGTFFLNEYLVNLLIVSQLTNFHPFLHPGSCIIGYWRHSASIITPVNCPTCRAPVSRCYSILPFWISNFPVSMILPLNWSLEVERENAENPNEHQENNIALNDYNRRFSTERPASCWFYIQKKNTL